MGRVALPLKWHGGKYYLAPQIVALMPRHLHYVEPFAGGLAVLLARDPQDQSLWLASGKASTEGVSEVVNDLDGALTNFWRVLQSERTFARFRRRVEAMPLSRVEWLAAQNHLRSGNSVRDAVAFFVRCRQSLAGRRQSFTPLTRSRTRRAMNGNASEWLGAIEGLPAVHARLQRVVVENMPAVELICREDGPSSVFYCDPPYLHSTRAATKVYEFEMTEAEHRALLDVLTHCVGKVMLSGYPSQLYHKKLSDWNRHEFNLPNNAAGGKKKGRETELLWTNF